MMEVKMISLLGGEISVYGLAMILGCAAAAAWLMIAAGKKGMKKSGAAAYGLLCVLLGLLSMKWATSPASPPSSMSASAA